VREQERKGRGGNLKDVPPLDKQLTTAITVRRAYVSYMNVSATSFKITFLLQGPVNFCLLFCIDLSYTMDWMELNVLFKCTAFVTKFF